MVQLRKKLPYHNANTSNKKNYGISAKQKLKMIDFVKKEKKSMIIDEVQMNLNESTGQMTNANLFLNILQILKISSF